MPDNSLAWLSSPTLRFFSLAEQCHTQKSYLRCFNSDFDAVKSKFGIDKKSVYAYGLFFNSFSNSDARFLMVSSTLSFVVCNVSINYSSDDCQSFFLIFLPVSVNLVSILCIRYSFR